MLDERNPLSASLNLLENSAFLDGGVLHRTRAVCCPANHPPQTHHAHTSTHPSCLWQQREFCPEGECGVREEAEETRPTAGKLLSGERAKLADVGGWLKKTLKDEFAAGDGPAGEGALQLSVKYIDPVRRPALRIDLGEMRHCRFSLV